MLWSCGSETTLVKLDTDLNILLLVSLGCIAALARCDLLLQMELHDCLCVCLSVEQLCEALHKWLNWSRCGLEADSCGSKEPCIRWGQDPPQEGAICGGCPAHLQTLGVCCWVRSKKSPVMARCACEADFCHSCSTTYECPDDRFVDL